MTHKVALLFICLTLSQSLYAKFIAVATEPVVWLLGSNYELEVKTFGNLTLGYSQTAIETTDGAFVNMSAEASRIQARYYFGSGAFEQGWVLGIAHEKATATVERLQSDFLAYAKGEGSASGVTVEVSYHWLWSTFFQGFGIRYFTGKFDNDEIEITDSNGNKSTEAAPTLTGAGIMYRLGWAF